MKTKKDTIHLKLSLAPISIGYKRRQNIKEA